MPRIHIAPFLAARLELKRSQALPPSAVAERRLGRFRALAAYVRQHSAYYRRIMEERGIDPATCKPDDFPVLTKPTVMAHFDEIVTDPRVTKQTVYAFLERSKNPSERFLDRYVVVHTSGSSGELGLFLFDPRAWARGIAPAVQSGGLGLFRRRRRVAFVGVAGGHFAGISMTGSARDWPLKLFFDFKSFEVNQPLRGIVDGLNAFKPDIIVSYGSALRALADAKLSGRLDIAPAAISSSGEAILAGDRTVIQQAFGQCLSNVYACSEFMFLGRQDPGSPVMRLFENDLIFEPGPDHTLVTNTVNRILPLIRYRLDDVLAPAESGGTAKAFGGVVGRMEQAPSFINADGERDWISFHTINELLIPNARRFQMRVTGPASFRFLLELEAGLDAARSEAALRAGERELRAALGAKGMTNVTFSIDLVESIPLDPRSGKFKLIVPAA